MARDPREIEAEITALRREQEEAYDEIIESLGGIERLAELVEMQVYMDADYDGATYYIALSIFGHQIKSTSTSEMKFTKNVWKG